MRKAVVIVIVVIAAAAVYIGLRGHGHPDYRDPLQLAQALKDAEHGTAADCAKITPGKYVCSVAGGSSLGTYQVTVTADGSGYQAN